MALLGARGLSLHAWVRGTPPPSVVFLHGLGHHARIWDFIADALPEGVGSMALDLRGHGDSAWSTGSDYSGAAFIDDLSAVLGGLDADPVILIGHSLGGLLALDYASKHPARVCGLAILDAGLGPARVALQRLAHQMTATSCFESRAAYVADLSRQYVMANEHALRSFAAHGLVALANGRFAEKHDPAVRSVLAEADLADAWTQRNPIVCPTLVLRGRRSAVLTRRGLERFVTVLPQARVVEIAGAGHALVLERPAEVAREVDSFLSARLRSA